MEKNKAGDGGDVGTEGRCGVGKHSEGVLRGRGGARLRGPGLRDAFIAR